MLLALVSVQLGGIVFGTLSCFVAEGQAVGDVVAPASVDSENANRSIAKSTNRQLVRGIFEDSVVLLLL